ncbi:hypothetical protein LBMAG53_21610 [Planctomycetota bacterium]|nr:hypothetical protein LBMAG53_21610 [Planctomycetota bacterium]
MADPLMPVLLATGAASLAADANTSRSELERMANAWAGITDHPDWPALPVEVQVEALDQAARIQVLRFRSNEADATSLAEAHRLTAWAAQLHPESYAVRASLVKIIEAMQTPDASCRLAEELLRVMERLRERAPLFRPDQRMSGDGT